MKKLVVTALLLLFTFSITSLKSEAVHKASFVNRQTSSYYAKSNEGLSNKCSLPCLKSKKCRLTFDIMASNGMESLIGNFLVTIFAPNGKAVATRTIDASTLASSSDIIIKLPSPTYAGLYTLVITNQNVTLADSSPLDIQPILQTTVTNSCNSQCLFFPVPVPSGLAGTPFPVGCSLQQVVNILPSFIPCKKWEPKCECKKK